MGETDGLRGWAVSVIAAAILAGVTEFALPKGRYEKSIRVLIALYMLIAFFSPLVSLTTKSEQIKSGLDELLEEREAQQTLEKTVKETLEREIVSAVTAFAAEKQMPLSGVGAKVEIDENHNISIARIEITMNCTAEEQKEMDDYVFGSFSVHPLIRSALNTREDHDDEAA